MDTIITVIIGIVVTSVVVIVCSLICSESTSDQMFRHDAAERRRKWLEQQKYRYYDLYR